MLIASRDIEAGTPWSEAVASMEAATFPLELRPRGFIAKDELEQFVGMVAVGPIPRGQVIIDQLFAVPTVARPEPVTDGEVAVSVAATPALATAAAGDRITIRIASTETIIDARVNTAGEDVITLVITAADAEQLRTSPPDSWTIEVAED